MDRRPIVHDSIFPIAGGSRDRRRGGWDSDPTVTRPRVVNFLRPRLSADDFATVLNLLNDDTDAWLGLGGESESEGGAMDARVRDHRPGQLATLFADAPNPSARNYR